MPSAWALAGPIPARLMTSATSNTGPGRLPGRCRYGRIWHRARHKALTAAQQDSPLAARPYDLRHSGVSLGLVAGIPASEVARRAGHSVAVLLRIYAGCIDGHEQLSNARLDQALSGESDP